MMVIYVMIMIIRIGEISVIKRRNTVPTILAKFIIIKLLVQFAATHVLDKKQMIVQ